VRVGSVYTDNISEEHPIPSWNVSKVTSLLEDDATFEKNSSIKES
jgi:hypothetical protein